MISTWRQCLQARSLMPLFRFGYLARTHSAMLVEIHRFRLTDGGSAARAMMTSGLREPSRVARLALLLNLPSLPNCSLAFENVQCSRLCHSGPACVRHARTKRERDHTNFGWLTGTDSEILAPAFRHAGRTPHHVDRTLQHPST